VLLSLALAAGLAACGDDTGPTASPSSTGAPATLSTPGAGPAGSGGGDAGKGQSGAAGSSPSALAPDPGTASPGAGTAGGQPAAPDLGDVTYDVRSPQVVATGLEVPWGLAFLPDGTALVAERKSGRILSIRPGADPVEVMTVPGVVASGEGGLLGLAVSPRYADGGLVYAYRTAGGGNEVIRFRVGEQPEVVVSGIASAGIHNGGRIAFGPDGYLYVGTGDAGRTGSAQDPGSLNGKILRVQADGSPAPGNPHGTAVWTLGHRNVQGLAWDGSGRLFATEFGQNTWDEVNLIEPGANYGWPVVEGVGRDPAFVDPLITWRPSDASPSGAALTGRDLYVAALRGERLWRLPLTSTGLGEPEALLAGEYGRLRTVAVAPDGALWLTTSNRDGRGDPGRDDDRVLRFAPVTAPR
jgi:glucose/arabinose dehydrogenase